MKRNLIFDFGKVLVGFDPHRLYDPYFGDAEKTSWFTKNVITEDWVRKLDRGDSFEDCIRNLQASHPEYAEAIRLYDTEYHKMVTGEMPGMYELIQDCNSWYRGIYGLSNWSYKVYDVMKAYPIFSLVEGFVISSDVHLLKPDYEIYRCLLERYSLWADNCIYIDDKAENVKAAVEMGMSGILFEDAIQLRNVLKRNA